MGLLFNRKGSSGNTLNTKRISDKDISSSEIRKISHEASFTTSGARSRFESAVIRAQSGGLTTKEVQNVLQDLIGKGEISRGKAWDIGKELGLGKSLLTGLKDMSEYHESVKSGTDKKSATPPQSSASNQGKGDQARSISDEKQSGQTTASGETTNNSSDSSLRDTLASKPAPTISRSMGSLKKDTSQTTKSKSIWEALDRKKHPETYN